MEIVYLTHPHQLNRESENPTVMALGYFDGVHLGHQQVIKTAKCIAEEKKVSCSVMTFNPHPKEVLSSNRLEEPLRYITPLEDKIKEIKKLQVDRLYIVRFDIKFSKLNPQQFVDQYLIGLHAVHVVAGFDYTYGSLGKGTMETLPFHSRGKLDQTVVEKVKNAQEKVSSTKIRSLLRDGKVQDVPELLGRYYEIYGTVVDGEKRGRTIGFPTANIQLKDRYILPKIGVYAVTMKILDENNTSYKGVCNIGYKPTFHKEQSAEPSIEVHLFNFSGDIYGKEVAIQWHFYIRGEKRFASVSDLIEQINKDRETAFTLLT